ncbi:MAG: hypothetical protein MK175_20145 [Pseudoalteromonas sp.]|nr:hypothetical protein [Pseudoalteromonas sp.]MCH2089500.1 hypothetical protein [Pseudoalteromonas sp.]
MKNTDTKKIIDFTSELNFKKLNNSSLYFLADLIKNKQQIITVENKLK